MSTNDDTTETAPDTWLGFHRALDALLLAAQEAERALYQSVGTATWWSIKEQEHD